MVKTKPKNRRRKATLSYPSIRGVDPPCIEPLPWYTVTLALEADVDSSDLQNIAVDQILGLAEQQLGITLTQGLRWNLRFLAVGVWNLSGGNVLVSFADLSLRNLSPGDKSVKTKSDEPGRNHWAHIEYVWPQSQRNFVHSEANNTWVMQVACKGEGKQRLLIHLYVNLRSSLVNDEPASQMTLRLSN